MTVDPHTEQKLLELIYDLLPEAESAELRSRIASDPALAEAYAQAQTAAGLFAEAARLHAPKLALTPPTTAAVPAAAGVSLLPGPPSPVPAGVPAKAAARKQVDSSRRARNRWAHLVVGLAASLLLAISLGGYWYHRGQLAEIAAEHLRVIVVGPAVVYAEAPAEFHVQTTSVTGDAMSAQVELTLYSSEGKRLWAHHQKCDDDGRLTVGIPADVKLPPRARLEVLAVHRDKFERFDMPLAVEPARYLTRLWTDRSQYRTGELVHCRSVSMNRWWQTAERAFPVRFQLRDDSGKVVSETPLETVTTRGVAADALRLAASLPSGQYVLTASSAEGAIVPGTKRIDIMAGDTGSADSGDRNTSPQGVAAPTGGSALASRPALVQPHALAGSQPPAPAQTSSDTQASAFSEQGPTKAEHGTSARQKMLVQFFPEGGVLAPGLENRVYLRAVTADGKPLRIRGRIVDSADNRLVDVQTGEHGLGRFSIAPRVGQQYRLKIDSPQQPDAYFALPPAMAEQKAAISLAQGVVDAGSPLEFTVRVSKPGLPLVAAAYNGEVLVAQQPVVVTDETTPASASMPLPAQASGVIRLVLYDFSSAPPRPLAERMVYRRPSRWLDVQLAGVRKHYKPGETVEISVQTTNEKGQHVPAVLGISAVAERGPSSRTPSAGGSFDRRHPVDKVQTPLAELLNEAGLPDGRQLVSIDRLLSESPTDRDTLELLLGAQPPVYLKTAATLAEAAQRGPSQDAQAQRSPAQMSPMPGHLAATSTVVFQPPALYDNLQRLREQYDARLRQYQADRTRLLNTLTTISFFGGLGLVLLVAMLGVLRIVSGWHLWAPAVGATVCCLIIGAVLIDPSRLRPDGAGLVAFASYQPTADKKALQENGRGQDQSDQPGKAEQDRSIPSDAHRERGQQNNAFGRAGATPGLGGAVRKAARQSEELRRLSEPEILARRAVGRLSDSVPSEETVFWHPLLDTGAEGRTTIAFRLPDRPALVRLRIDAHAQGRLGGAELELVVSAPLDSPDTRADEAR